MEIRWVVASNARRGGFALWEDEGISNVCQTARNTATFPSSLPAMALFSWSWVQRWTETGGVEIVIVFCIQTRGSLRQNW